jgi:hypothetical protein
MKFKLKKTVDAVRFPAASDLKAALPGLMRCLDEDRLITKHHVLLFAALERQRDRAADRKHSIL